MSHIPRTPRFALRRAMLTLGLLLLAACAGCRQTAASASAAPKDTSRPSAADTMMPREPALLLRGGRVMTATGVTYERGDVLIVGDQVAEVGVDLEVPDGASVVDVTGKTITPGLIDPHSHIGVFGSPGLRAHSDGNEATNPNTAHVRIADSYWPQDPQIERARAGGITTLQILPGSSNLIGGRTFTIKTYPDARTADDARMRGAPEGLKMSCGENPKHTFGEKGGPSTRMGNVAGFRAAFQSALEYKRAWHRYRQRQKKFESGKAGGGREGKKRDEKGPPDPPKRDFGLETLVKVLDGRMLVHCHCYRADEMVVMMDLAQSYGFRIRSFEHAVESYKIADRLALHGAASAVFSEWWGFKAEAYDGIRENAALLAAAGARATMHSDSGIVIQRLNQEAGKAMYAGRRAGIPIDEDEALRWVTANPAWVLGIEDRVGTLEPGKHADIVVWDTSPFSVYAKAERVYIEGKQVYDRNDPTIQPRTDFELGHREGDIPTAGEGATP
jgi:imidazolonepropionase-like amidohydrolase